MKDEIDAHIRTALYESITAWVEDVMREWSLTRDEAVTIIDEVFKGITQDWTRRYSLDKIHGQIKIEDIPFKIESLR